MRLRSGLCGGRRLGRHGRYGGRWWIRLGPGEGSRVLLGILGGESAGSDDGLVPLSWTTEKEGRSDNQQQTGTGENPPLVLAERVRGVDGIAKSAAGPVVVGACRSARLAIGGLGRLHIAGQGSGAGDGKSERPGGADGLGGKSLRVDVGVDGLIARRRV